jgi:RNA polymerase sigma factor (sigma-70 family)
MIRDERSRSAGVDAALTPPPSRDFEATATELLPYLRRLVRYHYGIPAQETDDIVHEAVLDFLIQARRVERVQPGLLVVIARRRSVDYWRRRESRPGRQVSLDQISEADSRQPVAEGDDPADGLQDAVALAGAWHEISARCRQYLARRFWKREPTNQIAASSGDRPESVKRFMSRCLAKLRLLMEEAT